MTPRAEGLAQRLAAHPRRRVTLAELWALLDASDPTTIGRTDRPQLLADAVDELIAAGVLTAGRERTGHPPLPRFVTRVAARPAAPPAPPVVWHPELSAAAALREPGERLRQVNTWLFRNAAAPPAPLRERAWEITGDEKAFDGGLGPLLTPEILRAYRVVLPLHAARVGPGDGVLVVENADTFDSLCRVHADRPGRVGRVAWGAGAAFGSSVLSLRADPPASITYFGDLDGAGLRIPAAASVLAVDAGLPPIVPAEPLYAALLEHGRRRPGRPVDAERARDLAAWLPAPHRAAVTDLLTAGQRMAQEAVGLALLRRLHGEP